MSIVVQEGARTKIIATMGDPAPLKDNQGNLISQYGTYKSGVCDIERSPVKRPTIESLVEMFIRNHADLIRMNAAHHPVEKVREDFLELKAAILKVEQRLGHLIGERHIGVLVDLPGPKIRFQNRFRLPEEYLTILFDDGEPVAEDSEAGRALTTPTKNRSVRINLGDTPFVVADPAAADKILDEVRDRLSVRTARNPLLAFIGDTECTLEVERVVDRGLRCKVLHDGTNGKPLGNKKGFTIRGIKKPIVAFTAEDADKLRKVLAADALRGDKVLTHVGISFCQSADDVRRAINCMILQRGGGKLPKDIGTTMLDLPDLIAKIETQEGLSNIEEILDFADGVMVARGDLALEMETVEVPAAAKKIIRSANMRSKTVIMATQMLESMQKNLECSRPEAFDVFNAVVDGVDALMLSGETSSGKYPALAIQKMRRLATEAEEYLNRLDEGNLHMDRYYEEFADPARRQAIQHRWEKELLSSVKHSTKGEISKDEWHIVEQLLTSKQERLNDQDSTDRITHAACTMAADGAVKALVAPTKSGRTARMLARFRPPKFIFAVPHNSYTARKLAIVWGTTIAGIVSTRRDMEVSDLMAASWKRLGHLAGSTIVFICGTPIGQVGTSNLLSRTVVPGTDAHEPSKKVRRAGPKSALRRHARGKAQKKPKRGAVRSARRGR